MFNQQTFCSNCGKELKPGVAFCNGCGKRVDVPGQQPASTIQTSAQSQKQSSTPPASSNHSGAKGHSTQEEEPQPLRVIAMQKKFALVACLKDLILPGNGFIYSERMSEGALIGLVTIPLTVWGVLNYLQLWFTDLLGNLRTLGTGVAPDFTASDSFKTWLIGLSLAWFIIRCFWLYYRVQEHNKQITKLADVNQLVAFVDGK
jgi:zinc-ribbon domain